MLSPKTLTSSQPDAFNDDGRAGETVSLTRQGQALYDAWNRDDLENMGGSKFLKVLLSNPHLSERSRSQVHLVLAEYYPGETVSLEG